MDPTIWLLVLALNLVTFLVFGFDKRRARKEKSRVSEATLHWLAFLTGAPGGWIAMSVFRHKTRKASFKVRMWLVTIVNPIWFLAWLQWRAWFPGEG